MEAIKRFFAPPVFAGDEEKTRAAELVNTMLLTQIGIFSLALVTLPFSGTRPALIQVIVGFMFPAFLLALLAFLRRGYVIGTGIAILVLITLTTSFSVAARGTIREPLLTMFILVSIFAGLVMGRRAAILSVAVNILIIAGLAYGEINRLLPPPESSTNSQHVVFFAMAGILTVVLLNQALRRIDTSLKLADVKQDELVALNKELSTLNLELEQRVADRTRAAEFAQHQAEAQAWSMRGHAQLSEQMRGELDLPTLTNNITSHLSHYIGAQTGALFVASGGVLKLTGRYAYVERAGQKSEFRLGESLVGEAAKSKRIILVDDIPADAPLVSSALGESIPRQILIAPFESNGQVLGVIEFATLTQFTPEHQDFLKRVSESVAIALLTAQIRVHVDELLAQSQRQAEELQAQEEELRASNEELRVRAELK